LIGQGLCHGAGIREGFALPEDCSPD